LEAKIIWKLSVGGKLSHVQADVLCSVKLLVHSEYLGEM